MNITPSTRDVLFLDHKSEEGVGIEIQFRDNSRDSPVVVHTLFMGDYDYNSMIMNWILFGTVPKYDWM